MEVSVFRNFWDKEPRSSTLEAMVEAIRSDGRTRELTLGFRQHRLDSLKNESMLFAVPCVFEGGKAQKNVARLTGVSMVDFDHILSEKLRVNSEELATAVEELRMKNEESSSAMKTLRQKIVSDPHTLLCYTTISGEGLRVLYRYELDEGFELKQQMQQLMKEDRKRSRELVRIRALYQKTIKPEVEGEGAVYAPGSHNDYVMRVGYRLNQFGFSLEAATEWAVAEFADYDKAASVIASCYEKTEEHGSRGGQKRCYGKDTDSRGFASVEEIEAFLTEHVKLRRNVITSRTEFLDEVTWRPISDTKVNSLWKDMAKMKRVNVQDIYRIIESDFVWEFHPFREYLDSLTPTPSPNGEGRDYIHELAETVRVKGGDEEQELFYLYLKKWLVAMVAAWVDESVVNNVILVLIGEQGSYKTTWFNYLLPPELKQYFYTKTNSNRMTKDDLLTLAQYGLVCCEELDTMSPRDLNQLKAAVTMPSIDERAAYAHYHEHRKHIASFCGTGNNVQFLSDPTGNRRWLPFEIEQIRNPRDHPFNYEGIYAEAYRLYMSGFQFWFDQNEIRRLSRHNEHYETPKQERELVDVFFRKPHELEGGEFMPVSRAMQIVGGNTVLTLSDVRLGRAFRDLGFACKRNSQGRGYIVVCRTTEEIKARQHMLAACDDQTESEEAMPF